MSYRDPAVGRERERVARRTAEHRDAGLCPKCGKHQPEPDRSICEPCAERARAAGRARDARLRAEGKPRRAPERAKSCQRGGPAGKPPRGGGLHEVRRQSSAGRAAPAAPGSAAPPTVGATPRPALGANSTGARTRRPSAGAPVSPARNAGRPGSMPACAPDVAANLPSREARPAGHASKPAASRTASGTASTGRRASASPAAARPSTASPGAASALPSRPSAATRTERMNASATPGGAPAPGVPIAAGRHSAPAVVPRAPHGLTSGPRTSGASLHGTRSSSSSSSPQGRSTAPTSRRPKRRPAWCSRSSRATRARS